MSAKAWLMSTQIYLTPTRVAALVPWFGLAVLLLFGVMAYAQVGHWPLYGRPDPKYVVLPGTELQVGGWLVLLVFLSAPASLIAGVVVALYAFCEIAECGGSLVHERTSRALMAVGVCGAGLYVFLFALGLHASWLLD